ncbi:MAG: pilus assembly protein N-terminal domain-containing protein, partial [Candidatus Omnitrophica bacterium]|nr:pilus assembly protein N-terminal domain-containing protein [Candidatus Omnitrophota bacterium]
MGKKIISLGILITFLFSSLALPFASASQITGLLYELGVNFYKQGRYDEALVEFKKALLVQPDYEPAIKYIQLIEQGAVLVPVVTGGGKSLEPLPSSTVTLPVSRGEGVDASLDLIELQKAMILEKQQALTVEKPVVSDVFPGPVAKQEMAGKTAEMPLVRRLAEIVALPQTLELEQGKQIMVKGEGIERFLVTFPDVLSVQQLDSQTLLVEGAQTGYSDLIVWDDTGRSLVDFLVVPPKPEGILYTDILKRSLEREENFRLNYEMDWSSYYEGRSFDEAHRTTYAYSHSLGLAGPTPYGDLDSSILVRKVRTSTDLIYGTIGLSHGHIGPLK